MLLCTHILLISKITKKATPFEAALNFKLFCLLKFCELIIMI
jgi:hypothetical protein